MIIQTKLQSMCFGCRDVVNLACEYDDKGNPLTLFCPRCMGEVQRVERGTVEELKQVWKNRENEK
jgi:hypothetical protein